MTPPASGGPIPLTTLLLQRPTCVVITTTALEASEANLVARTDAPSIARARKKFPSAHFLLKQTNQVSLPVGVQRPKCPDRDGIRSLRRTGRVWR